MKTQIILETLRNKKRLIDDILNILIGGYSYQRMKRRVFCPTLPDFSETRNTGQSPKRQKHNLYSLLYKLQKQGLIEKNKKGNKSFWQITAVGKKRLEKLKEKLQNIVHPPKRNYKKEKDEGFNIVIFDIPEKERFKRKWLRVQLISLDFSMLQKSVWIGKNKLPKEFLEDLDYFNLVDFIHIFQVSKTGTIKEF